MRYVCSFAEQLPAGPLVITRDGRSSGRMLADVIRAALCAVGRDVIDADVAATPTTGILVRQRRRRRDPDLGQPQSGSVQRNQTVWARRTRDLGRRGTAGAGPVSTTRAPAWVGHERIGDVQSWRIRSADTSNSCCRRSTSSASAANRSACCWTPTTAPAVDWVPSCCEELGCQVTLLGSTPDGQFEHPPEPTAENLAGVCQSATGAAAQVGFCQDPDADRLAIIDAAGRYLGEEYTLAIAVHQVLRHRPGPIVTNCSSSRMSQDLAEQFGVPCFVRRSAKRT